MTSDDLPHQVSGLSASSFNKHARLDVTGDGAGAVASAERGGRGAIPGAPGAGALPGAPKKKSGRSAHAMRGAVFARLEDPMRRSLHRAIQEIESQLSWQPPAVYTLMWQLYRRGGRPGPRADRRGRSTGQSRRLVPVVRTSPRRLSRAGPRAPEPGNVNV
jgi:hypothetical protein